MYLLIGFPHTEVARSVYILQESTINFEKNKMRWGVVQQRLPKIYKNMIKYHPILHYLRKLVGRVPRTSNIKG